MCEPTTLLAISTAVSLAGIGVQADAGRRTANTQTDNLKANASAQQLALQRQADQQGQAASAQMNDAARQALHDSSLFDVVAGEYGGGNTTDRASAVASLQTGEQLATIQGNANTAQSETGFRSLASSVQANQQLASIARPTWLGTGLQIGGALLGAGTQYQAIRTARVPVGQDPNLFDLSNGRPLMPDEVKSGKRYTQAQIDQVPTLARYHSKTR